MSEERGRRVETRVRIRKEVGKWMKRGEEGEN